MTDIELVQQLEERSRLDSERVVRLTGNVDGEPFELVIFRGFSSSTTHPTPLIPMPRCCLLKLGWSRCNCSKDR